MPQDATPASVLIVDDDRGLLRLMEKSLRREGFATATATSGREAIAWLTEHPADLMLLDLKLPDLEGKDLIARLDALQRSVPFAIITGQGDERVAVEMMKRGALDYLIKDVQFQEFLPTVVRRALDRLRQDRRLAAAEAALKQELAFTSAVLDTSGALVLVLDREGRIVRFNRACEQTTGYAFDEVRGRAFADLLTPPEDRPRAEAAFRKLVDGEPPGSYENLCLTRDGARRPVSWSTAVLRDSGGRVEFVVGTGIDVTERRRLEREILEISSREQQRIGQDLHDGLGQQLAGIGLLCEVFRRKLASRSKADAAQAEEIARAVAEAITHARDLARGLSPVQLEANGLMAALEELAAGVRGIFRIDCRFECATPVLVQDNRAATHLYRIAQEAINNAVKHGKARNIVVSFGSTQGRPVLAVTSDGAPFPDHPGQGPGMGLRIMKYRAGEIGATLQIRSNGGQGTLLTCALNRAL